MSGSGRRGNRVVSVGDMLPAGSRLSASDMVWLARGRMFKTLQGLLKDRAR